MDPGVFLVLSCAELGLLDQLRDREVLLLVVLRLPGGDPGGVPALLGEFHGPRLILIRAPHRVPGFLVTYGFPWDHELGQAVSEGVRLIPGVKYPAGHRYRVISVVPGDPQDHLLVLVVRHSIMLLG